MHNIAFRNNNINCFINHHMTTSWVKNYRKLNTIHRSHLQKSLSMFVQMYTLCILLLHADVEGCIILFNMGEKLDFINTFLYSWNYCCLFRRVLFYYKWRSYLRFSHVCKVIKTTHFASINIQYDVCINTWLVNDKDSENRTNIWSRNN